MNYSIHSRTQDFLHRTHDQLGLLLILVLVVTGCTVPAATTVPTAAPAEAAPASTAPPAPVAAAEPIKIGVIMPLTGAFAASGSYVVDGIKIGLDRINGAGGVNGHMLELVIEDGKADPKESLSVFEKLSTRDNVSAIIGAWISSATLAVVPAAERNEVPLVVETSGHPNVTTNPAKKWVFRFSPTFGQEAVGLEKCVLALGFKEAAFIANDNDWGRGTVEEVGAMLTKNGIKVGLVEYVQATSNDFYPQLTKIKNTTADVIFFPNAASNTAKVLQQAKELGLQQTIISTGGSNFSDEVLRLAGPEAADGSYHLLFFTAFAPENSPDPELSKWFVDAWNQKGLIWDGIANGSRGFDAISSIAKAIELGGGGDREQIRSGLEKVEMNGLTAQLKFDANHNAAPFITLVQIKDGKSQIAPCNR